MKFDKRGVLAGALIAAVATTAALAGGCGRQQAQRVSQGATPAQAVVVEQAGQPIAPPLTSRTETTPAGRARRADSPDSLPPEVAASVAESRVTPGSVVEITAEGSADVVEVTLADRLGRRQAFAYDSAANLWRVFYRVPLKGPDDRLGLSVTATNELGRWRRVWLFLKVEPAAITPEPELTPDPGR